MIVQLEWRKVELNNTYYSELPHSRLTLDLDYVITKPSTRFLIHVSGQHTTRELIGRKLTIQNAMKVAQAHFEGLVKTLLIKE